ncbi:MAG TPA: hypothetical protein VES20_06560 [Bryobacteraceae bacterium]|nr:hypothetical protein [Bryobacteraceae bacterium]
MRPAYLLCFFALFVCAQRDDLPPFTRAVTDPGVVTTRQAITPAGVQSVFNGRVYGAAFGQDSSDLYVLNASAIYRLDPLTNASRGTVTLGGTPGLQALRYDDRFKRILFAENPRGGTGVQLVASAGEKRQVLAQGLGSNLAGSIAVSTGGQPIAAVPLTANNRVALIDADSGRTLANVDTGIAPFGAVLSRDGSAAWVSNWGGRKARPGELTAPTGSAPNADQVVVDKRGIAATGTVTRIDVAKGTATHTVAVGLHPTALALDEQRQRLYVANSNSDSISVIDTAANRVVYTIQLQPFGEKTPGVAPTALVLSADGKRLFAACGGINAVAVLDAAGRRVEGLIPTSWYPNALALSPDGRKLAVTALLGVGSGSRETPKQRFVHSYRGTVHVLDIPDAAQLASYSTAVAENNRLQLAGSGGRPPVALAPRSQAPARAVPQRAGEASLIEHVVFIIKENRTYDQVLGALPQGNGDRSLVMFGRDVTPNQHKLA